MKKLSVILVILGVLVGISPLVGQWYTRYQENRMIEEWLNSVDVSALEEQTASFDPVEGYGQLADVFAAEAGSSEESDEAEATAMPETNAATPAPGQPGNTAAPAKAPAARNIIGIIQIDKIKLKAPIVEGVTSADLKAGVGHIPGTAALGQPGNCALAGHRNYTFGKFFNRLDEIVEGDTIVLTTKKEDLKYKVYEKLVVKPDDVSVLKGRKDDNIITLITCTPIYVATHRLIVHARLEERILKEP